MHAPLDATPLAMTLTDPAALDRPTPALPPRLVAWVDGAGAFLLCLNDAISFGSLGGRGDVRLTADLASCHATVRRSGEGYVVEATGPTLVSNDDRRAGGVSPRIRGSGRIVSGSTDLNDADELVFYRDGVPGVRLRMSRPNALTNTAVLTVTGGHRTDPRFDGIVLMAEACVLGPGRETHIRCRHAEAAAVLFRRDGGLWVRSDGLFTIDGFTVAEPVPVGPGSRIAAGGVSFRLEAA